MTRCTDIPLSWLCLERLALGELEGKGARAARRHIGDCAACAGALASIEADRRQLRALRLPEAPRRSRLGIALRLTAGAAAMAALLFFFAGRDRDPDGARARQGSVKGGGDTVVGLVRERSGAIDRGPEAFLDGDRFKVSVTCRAPGKRRFDVVVFQGGASFRPLGERVRVFCGNDSLIPGAFRVTGGQPFTVCLAPDPPVDLESGRVGGPACVTVPPADL